MLGAKVTYIYIRKFFPLFHPQGCFHPYLLRCQLPSVLKLSSKPEAEAAGEGLLNGAQWGLRLLLHLCEDQEKQLRKYSTKLRQAHDGQMQKGQGAHL